MLYSPTLLLSKLTLLFQLERMFTPTKTGAVFLVIRGLVWLNVGFYIANILSIIFQCTPVQKAWKPSLPGKCLNSEINYIVTSGINILSDVSILILPLWAIRHLQVPLSRKLGVAAIFAAGILYVILHTTNDE